MGEDGILDGSPVEFAFSKVSFSSLDLDDGVKMFGWQHLGRSVDEEHAVHGGAVVSIQVEPLYVVEFIKLDLVPL